MSSRTQTATGRPKMAVAKATGVASAAGAPSAANVADGISSFARDVAGGLREAIAFVKGEASGRTARVTSVDVPDPAPDYQPGQVAKIRGELGLTQVRFARLMNVSTTSVEGWESGKKSPGPASRRLLQMVSDEETLAVVARLRGFKIVKVPRAAKASGKGASSTGSRRGAARGMRETRGARETRGNGKIKARSGKIKPGS